MKIKVLFCCVVMVVLYNGQLFGGDWMPLLRNFDDIKQLEREKEQLQSEKDQLSFELDAVKQQLKDAQDKAKSAQSELSNVQQKIESQKAQVDEATTRIKKLEWWRWIVCGIVCIVLVIAALLFGMGRRKPAIIDNHDDELPKCPRCGWKYVRGETKCRNCGTRF